MHTMTTVDRNLVWGFAIRTQKNLDYLMAAGDDGADVHLVTQLITSMLGLLIFPYEELKRASPNIFKSHALADLAADGWPTWTFSIGQSQDLDDLLRHLRNSVSHRRIRFSSESRKLQNVEIEFRDRPRGANKDNWGASLNAKHLHEFVRKFSDLIRVTPNS
jgi:hypothetical protein